MTDSLIWAILLPLGGGLLSVLMPGRAGHVGVLTLLGSLVASCLLLWEVDRQGVIFYALGGWAPGLGIALRVDGLSALLLSMTNLVALAIGVYATAYFRQTTQRRHYWPLWLLLVTALNALFLAADLFNLYVTLELLGLTAVALTAMSGHRAALQAAIRYLLLGLLWGLMLYEQSPRARRPGIA